MTDDCIFCQIINREAQASVVYEDEKAIAFLSNRPINLGHTLVVPKKHYKNIFDIPEEELAYLHRIVKKVACAVRAGKGVKGIKIIQNNGEVADQVIFHIHVHIIPMSEPHSFLSERRIASLESLENEAEKIRKFL